jgi:sulfide:quinone oxidoreductase
MVNSHKPHVVVLGGNFAGLTTARFIRERCGDAVDITLIDRKPYLLFVPNIPLETLADRDPAQSLHMPIIDILANDGTYFVQGTVTAVNLPAAMVSYTPAERPGAAPERFRYDYLVLALGARLAFDKIEGFGEYGHTFTDTYYGNKLRRYLHNGGYKGGPIAIGSSHFRQGKKGKPAWLPDAEAACEGPALEAALALAAWLEEHKAGGAKKITLFTPGKVIAEDAGERIVAEFLGMATQMGFNYKNNTRDISRITAEGIEFASGDHLEAELKIVFPNWEPHEFIRRLPITDEAGFVVTDLTMRNPDYPNVFAVGDCASVTVPKLGTHGHRQAEIVSKQIAKDLGKISAEEADKPFWPEIICIGDMGRHRAFYIHSDTWYGGKVSEFKKGYRYQALKLGFKKMYYQTGGKPPSWGIALTEFLAEQL